MGEASAATLPRHHCDTAATPGPLPRAEGYYHNSDAWKVAPHFLAESALLRGSHPVLLRASATTSSRSSLAASGVSSHLLGLLSRPLVSPAAAAATAATDYYHSSEAWLCTRLEPCCRRSVAGHVCMYVL